MGDAYKLIFYLFQTMVKKSISMNWYLSVAFFFMKRLERFRCIYRCKFRQKVIKEGLESFKAFLTEIRNTMSKMFYETNSTNLSRLPKRIAFLSIYKNAGNSRIICIHI